MPSIRRGILPRLTYTRERTKCILLALASRVWKRVYSIVHHLPDLPTGESAVQPFPPSPIHLHQPPTPSKTAEGETVGPKANGSVAARPRVGIKPNLPAAAPSESDPSPRRQKKKPSVVTCIHECRHLIASVDFVNPSGGPQATCGRLVRVLQYLGLVARAVFLYVKLAHPCTPHEGIILLSVFPNRKSRSRRRRHQTSSFATSPVLVCTYCWQTGITPSVLARLLLGLPSLLVVVPRSRIMNASMTPSFPPCLFPIFCWLIRSRPGGPEFQLPVSHDGYMKNTPAEVPHSSRCLESQTLQTHHLVSCECGLMHGTSNLVF